MTTMSRAAILAAVTTVLTGFALTGTAASAATTPTCFGHKATLVGTSAADKLVGTPHRDVIVGLGGGDTIRGRGGNDLICGGNNPLNYDEEGVAFATEHLVGGAGGDPSKGHGGFDEIPGGAGDDVLYNGPGGPGGVGASRHGPVPRRSG